MYEIIIDNDEAHWKGFYRILDKDDAQKILKAFPNRQMIYEDPGHTIVYAIGNGSNGNVKTLTVSRINKEAYINVK